MKRGDLSCEFIISPPEYIANHIPKNVIPIFPVIPSVSLPTPSKEEIEAPQRLKLSERKNRSISERLPPGQIWDEKVAIPQE